MRDTRPLDKAWIQAHLATARRRLTTIR